MLGYYALFWCNFWWRYIRWFEQKRFTGSRPSCRATFFGLRCVNFICKFLLLSRMCYNQSRIWHMRGHSVHPPSGTSHTLNLECRQTERKIYGHGRIMRKFYTLPLPVLSTSHTQRLFQAFTHVWALTCCITNHICFWYSQYLFTCCDFRFTDAAGVDMYQC